jgi:YfiH family protein
MSVLQTTPFDGGPLHRFAGLDAEPRLAHAFAGRPWNWAPHRGPDRERAIDHRRRLCAHLGVSFDRLTSPRQIHNAELLRVEDGDIGAGRFGRDGAVPFVDGLLTDRPDVPLILLSADCPLVLVFDPARPALGIAHASWLGTVGGISARLVERMIAEFRTDPTRCRGAVAPSAGPDRYEVGPEVLRLFRTRMPDADRFFRPHGERYLLDLWSVNAAQLTAAGLAAHRIEIAGVCTIADQRFWSHRRDGPTTGRNALIAAIRPDATPER